MMDSRSIDFELGALLQVVQVHDIGVVVLAMVELQGFLGIVGCQGVDGVRQSGQGVFHVKSSSVMVKGRADCRQDIEAMHRPGESGMRRLWFCLERNRPVGQRGSQRLPWPDLRRPRHRIAQFVGQKRVSALKHELGVEQSQAKMQQRSSRSGDAPAAREPVA